MRMCSKVCRPISRKGQQRARIRQQKLPEVQKMPSYGFADAEKANFERNIEMQHLRPLAFVNVTSITNPRVIIRT